MSNVFENTIKVDASGNATVDGNLTVNGTTTTIDTVNLTIKDKLIELANGTTGTPSGDAGIIIERGSSTNAAMGVGFSTQRLQLLLAKTIVDRQFNWLDLQTTLD